MDIILLDKEWYRGYCEKKASHLIKHRHLKGILTEETYEKIFFHFGFKKELIWTKN